jgi:predicted DNA-binding transcriptional regulator YafY
MSLNTEPILRYKVIDACLRNKQKPYPSMQDLIDACNAKLGKEFTVSTIQKDIQDMKGKDVDRDRLGYKAPIKYSKAFEGYYYTDPDYSIEDIPLNDAEIDALFAARDLVQSFAGSRVSENFNHLVEKLNSYVIEKYNNKGKDKRPLIQTENAPLQRGFQYFELFFSAIKKKQVINFLHYSYDRRSFSSPIVHPYLLKEFQNRWYIIGYSETHEAVRTFGLDRVHNPIYLNREFVEDDSFDPSFFLNDIYGIRAIGDGTKQKIKFKVDPKLSNYIISQPIHKSQQKVGASDDGHIYFELDLIPSIELLNEFYGYSPNLWVIKPAWMKNEITKMLEKAINDYKIK